MISRCSKNKIGLSQFKAVANRPYASYAFEGTTTINPGKCEYKE